MNPPFGSILQFPVSLGICEHVVPAKSRTCSFCGTVGVKKGPTAWVRKSLLEASKGKLVVLVYPLDKWIPMLMLPIVGAGGRFRNLGDVKWLATEDRSKSKGTGRHIGCWVLGEP